MTATPTTKKLTVTTDIPTEITMTRSFDAPRRLLVIAMTKPELLKKWNGGVRATVVSAELDFRVGGAYRTVFRANNGHEFSFSGTYLEISDDRIVFTEAFNDMPEPATIITTYVETSPNTTTMTVTMKFSTQEIRDMVLATGMADGAGESYDALAALVATL